MGSGIVTSGNLCFGSMTVISLFLLYFLIIEPNFPPLSGSFLEQAQATIATETNTPESAISGLNAEIAIADSQVGGINPEATITRVSLEPATAIISPAFVTDRLMGLFPYMIGVVFLVLLHIGALVWILLILTDLLSVRAKVVNHYLSADQDSQGDDSKDALNADRKILNTKIELACAYINISDFGEAKKLIDEVLSNGDKRQKQAAQKLADLIKKLV